MVASRLRLAAFSALFAACALPACSSDPTSGPPTHDGTEGDPLASALAKDTGVVWVVARDDRGRVITVAPLHRPKPLLPGATAEDVAKDFFTRYGALVGVTTPATELALDEVREDADGTKHVLFSQRAGALPVFDGGCVVHVNADGGLAWVEPTIVLGAKESAPSLAKDDAIAKARSETGLPNVAHEPVLGLLGDRLAWMLSVSDDAGESKVVAIDAKDGSVLEQRATMAHIVATARTTKSYIPAPFDTQEKRSFVVLPRFGFNDWTMGQPYVPKVSIGIDVRTFIAQTGFTSVGDPIGGDLASDRWDDTGKAGAGSAVDAYTNLSSAAGWFQRVLAQESFDGKGSIVKVFVHRNLNGAAAGYMPGDDSISFEDAQFGGIFPPAAAFDVAAHEYTHAVVTTAALNPALKWAGPGRATAPLNEALADIFAASAEHDLKPGPGNLLIMEDAPLTGRVAERDLQTPSNPEMREPQRDIFDPKMNPAVGSPYVQGGVATKAWALMNLGGTHNNVEVPGALGWDETRDLWWQTAKSLRADVAAWQMPAVARNQIANARNKGWPTQKVDIVACAWHAVNALDAAQVKAWLGRTPKCDSIPPDSCVGKPTRQYYCSELVPFSAYYCDELGGIALGAQCLGRCKKKGWEPLAPADVRNGELQCDPL